MRADFALDYDVLTVQHPQKLYLLARLIAGPAPDSHLRRPLNLSVVIDRSGSMSGEKLNYTRQAAQFLVQNLNQRDTLSIVLYNENVETLVLPEPVRHKDAINQRLDVIKSGGTTNLSGGWLEGCNHVARNLNTDYLNRVILMTDGLANRGITERERLVALAGQKFESGISTTTMGLGTDFNEDLLVAIATAGGGAFYFIESPEVAPLIFREELRGLLSVVGQNLSISLELSPYVTAVDQLNAYPSSSERDRVAFRLGDVFGEEIKTLALELSLSGLDRVGEVRIAVLRFEYDELSDTGAEHRIMELPVVVNVQQEQVQPLLPNPQVSQTVLLLKAAQARSEAINAADRGNYTDASQVLERAAEAIAESGIHSVALDEEQKALLKEAADLSRGADAYTDYSRKMMSTQAIYTMTDRHGSTQAMRVRELERSDKGPSPARPARKSGVMPTHMSWNDRIFPLDGDLIRIGRAAQNEIIIKASGVSRFHCQIRRENGKLILEDLSSTNGTIVDGEIITQPVVLNAGDEVYLWKEKLTFHAG